MNVIFFEYIDLLCLAMRLISFRRYREVYYFNISGPAKIMLKILGLDMRIKYFDFNLSEFREESGENSYPRIFGKDLIDICGRIADEALQGVSTLSTLGNLFNRKKITICLRKILGKDLESTVIFMNAIKWHRQNRRNYDRAVIEFSLEKGPFFKALKEFAFERYGLHLISNPALMMKMKILALAFRDIVILGKTFFASKFNGYSIFDKKAAGNKKDDVMRVGASYKYYGVTFDLASRCDFPWLLFSGIPFKNILIYFDSNTPPITDDTVDCLKKKNDIGYVAMSNKTTPSKNMPVYNIRPRAAEEIKKNLRKLFPHMLRDLVTLRLTALYYIDKVLRFVEQYSRACDFYAAYNIKIDIDRDEYDPYVVARQIALKDTGGISVSYQQANCPYPTVYLGLCADVAFVFGPYHYPVFEKGGSDNETVVYSGFLTDYAFKTSSENSNRIRKLLAGNGAKFILCYFDEGSQDGRTSTTSKRQGEYVYGKLLNLVLSDKDIGLVLSPKRPALVQKQISGIYDVAKRAEATGRCLFMDGDLRTNSWPAEAAQAADLAIGSLLGGTTILESFLSGVRSVYLDLEQLYSLPEYKKGKNAVVFDDLDSLISAINRYRKDRNGFDEFGNISVVYDLISQKDPFRDGMAAERMGKYIAWLLDGFNKGVPREAAMSFANKKYRDVWTEKSVMVLKNKEY